VKATYWAATSAVVMGITLIVAANAVIDWLPPLRRTEPVPRVLTAFGEGAGVEQKAFATSRDVLAEHGNMSSATLLFILHRLRQAGAEAPVVAVAFGPGLVAEVALLV
jgi:hypothetical protein